MAWFTGANKDNVYEVGTVYTQSKSGAQKRANADGSFTDINTGRRSVGSSRLSDTVYFSGDDNPGDRVQRDALIRQSLSSGGDGSNPSTGVGVEFASTGVNSVHSNGPGSSGATRIGRVGSSLTLNVPKTTDLYFGGKQLAKDAGTSDGGDYEDRWGEVGGSIAGLAVMIADGWTYLNQPEVVAAHEKFKQDTRSNFASKVGSFVDHVYERKAQINQQRREEKEMDNWQGVRWPTANTVQFGF